MSAKHLHLLLLAVLCVSTLGIVGIRFSVAEPDDRVAAAATTKALPVISPETVPTAPPPVPDHVVATETPIEIHTPVESVVDRGDAMLFESRALFATPFDEAVVAPYR